MTPRALTYEALDSIGVSTIAAATSNQKNRIARDINAALQEINLKAPRIYKTRRGQQVLAAETISVTVTSGSADVTSTATFVDGCTIKLDGSGTWNEIRTESGQKKLLIPYDGTSGTISAMLYHDVLELDADAAELSDRPLLESFGYLDPAVNREDLLAYPREAPDYGRRFRFTSASPNSRITGTPNRFFLEPSYTSAGTSKQRIRLYPYPVVAVGISYTIKVKALNLAAADLGTDGADSTIIFPIQEDYCESILRPLFLERWTGSPWFRENDTKKSIVEDAKNARSLLTQLCAQRRRNRNFRAPL